MPTEISGSTGVNKIQSNAIEHGDLPTGSTLQVKQQVFSTFTQIASTSYVDTGLTLAITPLSTSSKILVIVGMQCNINNGGHQWMNSRLVRGSTTVKSYDAMLAAESGNPNATVGWNFLDSPNTASAITYKITMRGRDSSNIRINNYYDTNGNSCSTLTLIEIAG